MPVKSMLMKNDGFTLIEIMVAVAIIAILAAIAIPNYLGIQRKAARSEAKAKLEALSLSLEGYMAENNNYGPTGSYFHFAPGIATANFGHPGRIAAVAKLGNYNNYQYRIHITTALPPVYIIRAVPTRGRVQGDLQPWVTSDGQRGPDGFGW